MTHNNLLFRRIRIRRGYDYLRRFKSRTRRVRIFVPPLYVEVPVFEVKRARRLTLPAPLPPEKRHVTPPPPPPLPPPPPPPAKPPKLTREERKALRFEKKQADILAKRGKLIKKLQRKHKRLPKPPSVFDEAWIPAFDYQEAIVAECEDAGLPLIDIDGDIAHADHDSDWVHRDTLFVWPTRRLPRAYVARTKVGRKVITLDEPWTTVRIWFLVDNLEEEVSMLWSVAGGITSTPAQTFDEAQVYARDLYDTMVENLSDKDYIAIRGFMAWTAFAADEFGHSGKAKDEK